MKKILYSLNPFAQCREIGIPFWSCPQFVFLVMGVVTIAIILTTRFVGEKYIDGEVVALILLFLAAFLMAVSYVIVSAFEQVVSLSRLETKRSEEIIHLKDQFLFIAAHELRTPATAIKWGVKMLRYERGASEKSPMYDIIDFISKSNDRLLTLVQDVLETSRLQGGTISIALSPISVEEAYQSAMKELEGEAFLKKVKVVNDLPDSIPAVLSDEMRLKEILLNLISNAIKYSEQGGSGLVTITAKERAEDGKVVISVTNNGKGISPEEQAHVFEKFWRAKDVRTIEGTGLGLFIVRQLASLMQGEVTFTSKVGETAFFVTLKKAVSLSPETPESFPSSGKA